MSMYIRFAVLGCDVDSLQSKGVFQVALELRDSGRLQPHEEEWLDRELAWLKMHLKSPACLREHGNQRAISWFDPSAKRAIEKTRSIVALLEEHGHSAKMLTTKDPGTVLYADGWQVIAKPNRRRQRPREDVPDEPDPLRTMFIV